MSTVLNLGATDLSTAYDTNLFKPGTQYVDDFGGIYTWGVYVDATVTAAANVVCVPVISSTNRAVFTGDITDTDADIQKQVGYSPARMESGKRGWFKTGGFHKVKECSTTTGIAKGTMFRTVGTDKTVSACTTFVLAAGIALENFSTSATSLKWVQLFSLGRPSG